MPEQENHYPIIHDDQVTFLWKGSHAPVLIGDFNDWDEHTAIPLKKAGRGTWSHTMSFPKTAYIEYAYFLDGQRVADPGNPRTVFNGMNGWNHYFYMPGGGPTPLAQRKRNVPKGFVTRHILPATIAFDNESMHLPELRRMVYLYKPPVAGPYPLVVVYDGNDYLRRANLPVLLDNLLAQERIQPFGVAMLSNGKSARFLEYCCSEATLAYVQDNLLALAREHLDLYDINQHPGSYGILGASMGGLMALYSGMRLPHIFGKAMSQSGAFASRFVLNDLVQGQSQKPGQVWMDVGQYEFLLEPNRRMRELLSQQGVEVHYQEYPGGHNYTAWRDDLSNGLELLFGLEKQK